MVEDMTTIDLELIVLAFEFWQIIHCYAMDTTRIQNRSFEAWLRKNEGLFFLHPSNSDRFHEKHGH